MTTLFHYCVVSGVIPHPPFHFLPPRLPNRSTNFTLRRTLATFSRSRSRIRFCSSVTGIGFENEENNQRNLNSDEIPAAEMDTEINNTDSFLIKLVLGLGVAVAFTFLSIPIKMPGQGPSFALHSLADASSSSSPSHLGFAFQAFGYRVLLPEYAPGWLYFWLLMAAGCGLFISEEALNIWVGVSLSRLLLLDGTWQSFSTSFSRHAPYIVSTILWVYWGVCISDMVPFYLGKLFRQANASDEVYSKFGIGKDKVQKITEGVRKYGNLIGFVERFSIGMRNPTAFVAGALGISSERFFAGVCLGGLITLPIQLAIGFMLRERPMFAIATVATAVGIWTFFPYVVAASTALFLFVRNQIST
ncbi:unnamed protein product [Rhodiola kirilowii]